MTDNNNAPAPAEGEAGTGNVSDAVDRAFASVEASDGPVGDPDTLEAMARLKGDDKPAQTGKESTAGDDDRSKPKEKADAKADDKAKADAKPKDDKAAKADDDKSKAKTDGPERDESGRFKSKAKDGDDEAAAAKADDVKAGDDDAAGKGEADDDAGAQTESKAPARFTPEAKAAYDAAPPELQEQVTRMEAELTEGIQRNADSAKKYEAVAPYEQLAAAINMSVPQVLQDYANGAQMIRQAPHQFMETMLRRHGHNPEDVAAAILGSKPNEKISQLQSQLAQATNANQQLVNQVRQFQEAERSRVQQGIEAFAKDKPRFQELTGEISFQIQQNHPDMPAEPIARLKWAYDRASKTMPGPGLKPALDANAQTGASNAATASAQTEAAAANAGAQTEAAAQSISGAPGRGQQTGTKRKPSATPEEAVDKAFEGLSF